MGNTTGSISGASTPPSSPSTTCLAPGEANTFGSLKSLFKQKYPTTKKCKHCGQQFVPKE